MSTLALTDLADILVTNFGPLIVEGLTQRGPGNDMIAGNSLWGLLAKHGRIQIGAAQENATKPMDWAIHTTTQQAQSYGVNDNYGAYTPEGWAKAQLDWKRWGTPFETDDLIAWALGKGGGAARGNINAIEKSIKMRLKAIVDKGNTMLGTDGSGNNGKDVTGFKASLAAAGTYAGVALTQQYFAPTTSTVGGALNKTLIDQKIVAMEDKDGLTDSLVFVMRRNQWHNFRNLFTAQIRWQPNAAIAGEPIQPVWSDGGVTIPIEVISGGMPNDEVWLLNMNDYTLFLADQMPNSALTHSEKETIMYEGMPIGIAPIYQNSDKTACFFRMWGELTCAQPRRQGAFLGVTP